MSIFDNVPKRPKKSLLTVNVKQENIVWLRSQVAKHAVQSGGASLSLSAFVDHLLTQVRKDIEAANESK